MHVYTVELWENHVFIKFINKVYCYMYLSVVILLKNYLMVFRFFIL